MGKRNTTLVGEIYIGEAEDCTSAKSVLFLRDRTLKGYDYCGLATLGRTSEWPGEEVIIHIPEVMPCTPEDAENTIIRRATDYMIDNNLATDFCGYLFPNDEGIKEFLKKRNK